METKKLRIIMRWDHMSMKMYKMSMPSSYCGGRSLLYSNRLRQMIWSLWLWVDRLKERLKFFCIVIVEGRSSIEVWRVCKLNDSHFPKGERECFLSCTKLIIIRDCHWLEIALYITGNSRSCGWPTRCGMWRSRKPSSLVTRRTVQTKLYY